MNRYAPPNASLGEPPQSRASSWITKGLALFFAFYALYCCWTLFYRVSPLAVMVAGICGSAAVGLWLKRPWSRWVVYFISAGLCLYFAWYVWRLVQDGWPYEDWTRSFVSLLPGSVLLMFGIGAAVHLGRVFRRG
jgi:TRAP-type C4-dicarboxylate transport system permease small subunit